MQCPRCQNRTLSPSTVSTQKIELLRCASCNGVWASPDKLESLIGTTTASKLSVPSYALAAGANCPSCQLPLYEFIYPKTEVQIDGCKICRGLWFDNQELNEIVKAERNTIHINCPRCQIKNQCNKKNLHTASCSSCGGLLNKTPETDSSISGPSISKALDDKEFETDKNSVSIEYEWEEVIHIKTEYKFCLYAIPAMLFVGFLFNISGFGAQLQRIWLTMPVHEFGHALSAWFTGYNAIPSLWLTRIYSDSKGLFCPLLLLVSILYFTRYALLKNHLLGLIMCLSLLVLQFIGTFILSSSTADMLFSFGGDGMGLIIATALMSCFYYGKHTSLYTGALRWGFLAIGAAAFVDIYSVWFASLSDIGKVPYGTTGGRFTDSYKLVEDHGWTFDQLINRYLWLGNACLLCLGLVYWSGLRKAKSMMKLRDQQDEQ